MTCYTHLGGRSGRVRGLGRRFGIGRVLLMDRKHGGGGVDQLHRVVLVFQAILGLLFISHTSGRRCCRRWSGSRYALSYYLREGGRGSVSRYEHVGYHCQCHGMNRSVIGQYQVTDRLIITCRGSVSRYKHVSHYSVRHVHETHCQYMNSRVVKVVLSTAQGN